MVLGVLSVPAASYAEEGISVRDGIESARAIATPTTDLKTVFPSPDGQRYVVMIVRGDVATDNVILEVMAGQLDSMEKAQPSLVKQLTTKGRGYPHGIGQLAGSPVLTSPINTPTWLDNRSVTFLWENDRGVIQVVALDVISREFTFLTNSNEDVINYVAGPGGSIVYDVRRAFSQELSQRLLHEGFAVTSPDAHAILAGYVDGSSIFDFTMCDRYVLPQRSSLARTELDHPINCQLSFVYAASNVTRGELFSPDGRYMLVNNPVKDVPPAWTRYVNPDLTSLMKQRVTDPSQMESNFIADLGVLNIQFPGGIRTLKIPARAYDPLHISWAPDSESFLLWPTFTPPELADSAGVSGNAIAQFDVTGAFVSQVPLSPDLTDQVVGIRLISRQSAQVELKDRRTLHFLYSGGTWRQIKNANSETSRGVVKERKSRIRVEMREDMATPPVLYAIEPCTRRERVLLQLNPKFGGEIELARVESLRWQSSQGKEVRGRLYYPLHHNNSQKYPLVIQVGGAPPEDQFTIYGTGRQYGLGSGPGWAVHLAQAIAAQGIAVLQTSGMATLDPEMSELMRMQQQAIGIGVAAKHLVAKGWVDPALIGVMGHSINGRLVQYALTHPSFDYAAAIVSDAADANYLQAALLGWPNSRDDMNGGGPFGKGLNAWLANSPAFNVEHVQSPLQIQVTSSSDSMTTILSSGWEMFSRLRYLKKPVELYVAPDIKHGSHILQNPRQLLAVQTRALDWWRFWLKREERTDPSTREQYESWRHLRSLRDLQK